MKKKELVNQDLLKRGFSQEQVDVFFDDIDADLSDADVARSKSLMTIDEAREHKDIVRHIKAKIRAADDEDYKQFGIDAGFDDETKAKYDAVVGKDVKAARVILREQMNKLKTAGLTDVEIKQRIATLEKSIEESKLTIQQKEALALELENKYSKLESELEQTTLVFNAKTHQKIAKAARENADFRDLFPVVFGKVINGYKADDGFETYFDSKTGKLSQRNGDGEVRPIYNNKNEVKEADLIEATLTRGGWIETAQAPQPQDPPNGGQSSGGGNRADINDDL